MDFLIEELYYNEGKIPVLEKTDDPEEARKFLTMWEEAEEIL